MKGLSQDTARIEAFYAQGFERARLAEGVGALELLRTQSILSRVLPAAPAIVADVGGGPGRYALWLAERGFEVHLIDPLPLHVEQARTAATAVGAAALASAEVGDARALRFPDESVDVILLLGPLYHLVERADRIKALDEARRVSRRGGIVVAAAISRCASTLDGLRNGYLDDPLFAAIAAQDRRDGQHRNPSDHPAYFTTAYFHSPRELADEFVAAGLVHEETVAVEGPVWLLPDLDAQLADEPRRATLLSALATIEAEPALLGVSAHFLGIGRRP